mmetsp:Transcript_9031/g.21731  ORF Transcript_9031/g.21731 Transcript_9031/m.21731 type:complete len:396 (+) Transcript_9031:107-1294(+)
MVRSRPVTGRRRSVLALASRCWSACQGHIVVARRSSRTAAWGPIGRSPPAESAAPGASAWGPGVGAGRELPEGSPPPWGGGGTVAEPWAGASCPPGAPRLMEEMQMELPKGSGRSITLRTLQRGPPLSGLPSGSPGAAVLEYTRNPHGSKPAAGISSESLEPPSLALLGRAEGADLEGSRLRPRSPPAEASSQGGALPPDGSGLTGPEANHGIHEESGLGGPEHGRAVASLGPVSSLPRFPAEPSGCGGQGSQPRPPFGRWAAAPPAEGPPPAMRTTTRTVATLPGPSDTSSETLTGRSLPLPPRSIPARAPNHPWSAPSACSSPPARGPSADAWAPGLSPAGPPRCQCHQASCRPFSARGSRVSPPAPGASAASPDRASSAARRLNSSKANAVF